MMFYNDRKRFYLLGFGIFLLLFFLFIKIKSGSDSDIRLNYDSGVHFSKEAGFYEDPFWLEMSAKRGTIYYTLDGSEPNKNSLVYEAPIYIDDVSDLPNNYSMREDVSTGFDEEEINRISSNVPNYKVPDYLIDKATIIRAAACDEMGNWSETNTATFFVNYSEKKGYEGMSILSIVTDPGNLFDYENGIYVTGKSYDDYVEKYRGSGEYYWREEFWGFWNANYRNRGIKWERQAICQFFNENREMVLSQQCGVRVHGGISRGYNPKSLNLYARKEYDGKKKFEYDFFETGYMPSALMLFQGGNDTRTKAKDYLVSTAVKGSDVGTMSFVPYVLFLNGEYWGIYWLNEKYNADFLSYYYGVEKNNVIMIKNGELEIGEEEDDRYYTHMVEYCSSADVTKKEEYDKVCELIDINNYIDYYAIMLYVGRSGDWPWLNFAAWRVDKTDESVYGDGKWRWLIFDLNSPGFSVDFDSITYVREHDSMFDNLMKNDEFREQLFSKIREYGSGCFNGDSMKTAIVEYEQFISEPMRANDKRFLGDESLETFYSEMEGLQAFFADRMSYMEHYMSEDN